jgi:hypothetical protein
MLSCQFLPFNISVTIYHVQPYSQMHLNKDNLYEQHVEFDHAIEVLCDNIKDYKIKKVELVRRHLTHSMLFLTLTTYVPFMISVTFRPLGYVLCKSHSVERLALTARSMDGPRATVGV